MKILLAGDSTVAHYGSKNHPMSSWGDGLSKKLKEEHPEIQVENFAKSGATTRSFVEEGWWEQLIEAIENNDIVVIQFGHNDQKFMSGVSPNDYYRNLQQMVLTTRKAGGQPVLCTPPERYEIQEGMLQHTLERECLLIKRLAKEQEIPLIDLNEYSYFYYSYSPNIEETHSYFTWLAPGEAANYPGGSYDDTHFSVKGGDILGRYVYLRLQPLLREAGSETLFDDLYYGACMYPELWEEEIVKEDIQHMKCLGMNFARIGEFIWSSLEPEEGVYDFSTLRHYLKWYHEAEIQVLLCIPTPTPPRWLTADHPERCIHNQDQTIMVHGSRQHVCTNHAYFRHRAYLLTRKIARLTKEFDNIIGIQLDNEFKCHVDLCFCCSCQEKWHKALQSEYGRIAYLNQQWGTKIWSEEYTSFAEIPLPLRTPFVHNSSLMNAFRLFTAESLNEFAHGLCHMIRMETDIPITHNTALGFHLMNQELFSELDFVSFDTYAPAANYPGFTLNLDLWKNVKTDVSEVMLLETSTSHAGHIENYIAPHPNGYLTAEAFAGFAGGLRSFCYWHFRGHRFGVEQPHSTVVTPWGKPGKGYQEVAEIGKMLQRLKPQLLCSIHQPATIGLIYSDCAKRFFTIESGGIYDYRSLITEYYGSLIHQGVSAEIIQESSDFGSFEILLVPFIRYISQTLLEKLKAFAEDGGRIVFGPLTGDRTEMLTWPEHNGLDRLGNWLEVENILQFATSKEQPCLLENSEEVLAGLVSVLTLTDKWQVLRRTAEGNAMWAKRPVGTGEVFYLGGLPENLNSSTSWQQFVMKEIRCHDRDIAYVQISDGLVKYQRIEQETGVRQFYLVNLSGVSAEYQLIKEMEMESGVLLSMGAHQLQAYETLLLKCSD
ncbi:beta-galactosidase [Enterococcus sp. BWB1-3]|uniref:beta-galactosidase n=1 Tax=Enterococcus sp. BWB1-3 TaxID=2787713 RepID=UPI001924E2E3|nr:beta-galactosidase [Enterococcus sp. BWB1-3]MBL1230167.1 beta-galactosidase [Enterococcus sp. BWB1-3]